MSCKEVRPQLDAYVEGELLAEERMAVVTHLAHCDACRRRADALEQMAGLLYQLPCEPAPDGLTAQIMARIGAERQGVPSWTLQTLLVAIASFTAGLMAVWLAFETAVAAQTGGILDFVSLLISRPQTLLAYPQDAVYALVESVPVTELVLTLGMMLVALLLLNQLLAGLETHRRGGWLGHNVAGY